MTGRIKLHVIHVSGSRMIAQGTVGLSRGGYADGVMSGASMLSFVPLHLSALDRMPSLLPWIRTWCPDSTITPLTPEEWFWEGHGLATDTPGTSSTWHPRPSSQFVFLWTPAPAAASVAVDELSLSRLKRTHLLHIFLCPRLCTQLWRKKSFKVADLVLELPLAHNYTGLRRRTNLSF
jgi:hypothetical protein